MHPLDPVLFDAWLTMMPKLLADPDELRARLARRRLAILTRPPRALCVAVRASDRRIDPLTTAIEPYRAADPADPREHVVHVDRALCVKLTQPVSMRLWRECTLDEAGRRLGVSPSHLSYARRKGIFRQEFVRGLLGRRVNVPCIWYTRHSHLDPCGGNAFAPPDAAWGSQWMGIGEALPAGFVQPVTRVPCLRADARTGRRLFRGWRWVTAACETE